MDRITGPGSTTSTTTTPETHAATTPERAATATKAMSAVHNDAAHPARAHASDVYEGLQKTAAVASPGAQTNPRGSSMRTRANSVDASTKSGDGAKAPSIDRAFVAHPATADSKARGSGLPEGDPSDPTAGVEPRPHLDYYGGNVLNRPSVTNIYVGDYWGTKAGRSDRASTDAFTKDFVKNPQSTGIWKQYGGGAGSFRGSTVDRAEARPKTIGEDQIKSIINQQIASGKVRPNNGQSVYTVYLPPGTVLTDPYGDSSLNGLGGYHGSFAGANGKPIYYDAIAYGQGKNGIDFDGRPKDALSIVASHELTETVTDPDVEDVNNGAPLNKLGWYDNNYGEIGDIALNTTQDPTLENVWGRMDGFAVQKEWSNQDGKEEIGPTSINHPSSRRRVFTV
jgi:hypothetical protein